MKDNEFSMEMMRVAFATLAWVLGTIGVAAVLGVFLGIVVRVARAVAS